MAWLCRLDGPRGEDFIENFVAKALIRSVGHEMFLVRTFLCLFSIGRIRFDLILI